MALLKKKSESSKPAKSAGITGTHWLYRVYLALVSFVAVVVMCVNLGILVTSLGKYVIISESEYLLSDRAWDYRACLDDVYDSKLEVMVPKTPEEIASCQEQARERILANRSLNLKETFIESLAWLVVFGILFGFHYPKFASLREEK